MTMPTIADYFQNVQPPTMPEVAQLLIRSLNDDDLLFEWVSMRSSHEYPKAYVPDVNTFTDSV